jgi:hypothetical protein
VRAPVRRFRRQVFHHKNVPRPRRVSRPGSACVSFGLEVVPMVEMVGPMTKAEFKKKSETLARQILQTMGGDGKNNFAVVDEAVGQLWWDLVWR